jgi:DNA-binding MarR family transcriptional regulator
MTRIDAGGGTRGKAVAAAELDAVLAACRILVAISAQSIAAVDDTVDLTQFRVLVIVGSGSPSLGEVAEGAGLSLSTASRMCDRLVGQGLLNRSDDPANRRQLRLTLTPSGRAVITQSWKQRQRAIEPVLRRLGADQRRQLVEALAAFAEAAGEPRQRDLWFLGWPTDAPESRPVRQGGR